MKAIEEIGIEKAFWFAFGEIQKALLKIAWLPPIRKALLQLYGCRIGKETVVLNADFVNLHRTGFRGLHIGNNCFVGDGCLFDLADRIELHDHVTLSQRVIVNTHTNVGYRDHALQHRFSAFAKPVIIESHCFVGVNSVLLAGTHVGERTLIGAASLAKGTIPAQSIVAGNPAQPIQAKTAGRLAKKN